MIPDPMSRDSEVREAIEAAAKVPWSVWITVTPPGPHTEEKR